MIRSRLYRLDDFRVRVAENGGTPGSDVIHIVISIDVPHMSPFGFADEERLAADGAKGADGRVDPPRDVIKSLSE